jgi:hypothetical protein
MPIDLISLIQSDLYIAAPKTKRLACRRALISWVQNPKDNINIFLSENRFNNIPKKLELKFNTWQKSENRPNYAEFIKKASGLGKKDLITLGAKYGLSSFESITLPGYLR